MSYLLELLGRGLGHELGDMLDRYYWSAQSRSVNELKSICDAHPDWPDVHLHLGLIYLRACQATAAIDVLRQSCRTKPDYLPARLALASAFEQAGNVEKALDQLKIANQTKIGEAPVLFAIGFCHEKLSEPEKAIEFYRDALENDENLDAARERLSAIALFIDDVDEAIVQYEELSHRKPQEPSLHGALGNLYHRKCEYAKAIEHYETAIGMEPENWSLIDDEVEALVEDQQYREAIERLHELIEAQGDFADLHCRLGDLYSRCGDDAAAIGHYCNALAQQPEYLEAQVKLGTHHLSMGRWDEAVESFCLAAELNDASMQNYVALGVSQLAAGQDAEAMNSFDLAVACEPNSTLLLTEMAKFQLKAAVADEYEAAFTADVETGSADIAMQNDDLLFAQLSRHAEEVKLHPQRADVRYRYGVMLRAESRLAEAAEQFSAAVEINPAYVQAMIKLGICQQEMGEIDEAIETFRKTVEIGAEFVDVHYRLGLLYTDRGEFENAVSEMEAASKGSPDNQQIRAGLALSLQNMGLMDRAAATWRDLRRVHQAHSA